MPKTELSLGPDNWGEVRRLEQGDPGSPGLGQTDHNIRYDLNHWAGKEGEVKGNKDPKEKS